MDFDLYHYEPTETVTLQEVVAGIDYGNIAGRLVSISPAIESTKAPFDVMLVKHLKHGLYALPGGRISPDEWSEDQDKIQAAWRYALPRELEEEIGDDHWALFGPGLKGNMFIVGVNSWIHPNKYVEMLDVNALTYLASDERYQSTPISGSEVDKCEWVNWEDIIELAASEQIFPNAYADIFQAFNYLHGWQLGNYRSSGIEYISKDIELYNFSSEPLHALSSSLEP